MRLLPIKNLLTTTQQLKKLPKPKWLTIKLPINSRRIQHIKNIIHNNKLHSVCEEASCPNLIECFHNGTATFMILGSICTRRCPFCNVSHGRPNIPDINEPNNLARAIKDMSLSYVVITSVNRDDLHDGGAQHFVDCITTIRAMNPNIKIEILVPDFRKIIHKALEILIKNPPDIFNHNLESIPRIYRLVRPGANYKHSLKLLKLFKKFCPKIPTKSGLMVGLGESNEEIIEVINDLYNHGVSMLTIGQYLQPSNKHLSVQRYVNLNEFNKIKEKALKIGFKYVFCGPFVRSSYRANLQATKVF